MASDDGPSKRFQVSVSTETYALLGRLARTGMFGKLETEVARTLIEEGVRQAFKDGFFKHQD